MPKKNIIFIVVLAVVILALAYYFLNRDGIIEEVKELPEVEEIEEVERPEFMERIEIHNLEIPRLSEEEIVSAYLVSPPSEKKDIFKQGESLGVFGHLFSWQPEVVGIVGFQFLDGDRERVVAELEVYGGGLISWCCLTAPEVPDNYQIKILLDGEEILILPFEVVE